jgi:uncharacterized protein (DUF2461 family)
MEGAFAGWKGDFKGFFLGLKLNNSKAYFESHRKQYEQDVKAPMAANFAAKPRHPVLSRQVAVQDEHLRHHERRRVRGA